MKIARSSTTAYSGFAAPSTDVSVFEQSLITDGTLVCWLNFQARFFNAARTSIFDRVAGHEFVSSSGSPTQSNDSQLNYEDIAYFDSTRRMVGPSILPTAGALSFVFAGRLSGSGLAGGRTIWGNNEGSAAGPYFRFNAGKPDIGGVFSPDVTTSPSVIVGTMSAAGAATIRVNGTVKNTGTITTTRAASLQFGGVINSATQMFFGNVAEAMVFSEDLSADTDKLSELEEYLAAKYAITLA